MRGWQDAPRVGKTRRALARRAARWQDAPRVGKTRRALARRAARLTVTALTPGLSMELLYLSRNEAGYPPSLKIHLKTVDLASTMRDAGIPVVSGFQSPIEKECL